LFFVRRFTQDKSGNSEPIEAINQLIVLEIMSKNFIVRLDGAIVK